MGSLLSLNPEYLSGDGNPAEHYTSSNNVMITGGNISASVSDLGRRQTQQALKDFFLED